MTTPPLHEDQLIERLHSLTATIDGPVPTAAVLRRGRAAVRRNRVIGTTAALSVFTAAGVLGATSGLLGRSEYSGRVVGPAGSPETSAAPTHNKDREKMSHRPGASTTWCGDGIRAYHVAAREYGPTLDTYRDLVAEHLDPQQRHLEKRTSNIQFSTAKGCVLDGLGTKLGWASAGDEGLGMVRVEVTTDWRQAQTHLAHSGWQPAGSPPAGAVRAYVADYAGGTAVAVTRTDGTTVALDADRLFGNNALTPATGMDVTADELLATAADPRFQMP